MHRGLVLAVAVAVLCPTGAMAQSKPLNGEELQKVFADGKLFTTTGRGEKRQGTWNVKGVTICHDSSVLAKCYKVTSKDAAMTDLTLQSEDFQWQPAYAMNPGNTENY